MMKVFIFILSYIFICTTTSIAMQIDSLVPLQGRVTLVDVNDNDDVDSVFISNFKKDICAFSPFLEVSEGLMTSNVNDDMGLLIQRFNQIDMIGFLANAADFSAYDLETLVKSNNIKICNNCGDGCEYACVLPFPDPVDPVKRYVKINYNPEEIAKLSAVKGIKNEWVLKFVLLHELQHTIKEHPDKKEYFDQFIRQGLSRSKRSAIEGLKQMELMCDLWAGNVAARLDATKPEVLDAISVFSDLNSPVYPTYEERKRKVEEGWEKGFKFMQDRKLSRLVSFSDTLSNDIKKFITVSQKSFKIAHQNRKIASSESNNHKESLSLLSPKFFIKESKLVFKSSEGVESVVGELREQKLNDKIKYVIEDEYFVTWYIDKTGKIYNHNKAVVGKVFAGQ